MESKADLGDLIREAPASHLDLVGDALSIDELFHRLNNFYYKANHGADRYLIFTRLVEALGGLAQSRDSKLEPTVAWERTEGWLPKAIVWWFMLCGNVGVTSVHQLLALKYPGVCPYCRERPHQSTECHPTHSATEDESADSDDSAINWAELAKTRSAFLNTHPALSLQEWQSLFRGVYPSLRLDTLDAILEHLFEETGELAQALQAVNEKPSEFAAEAADVFAWLMKLLNFWMERNPRTVGNANVDDPNWLYKRVLARYDSCSRCRSGLWYPSSAHSQAGAWPVCSCSASLPKEVERGFKMTDAVPDLAGPAFQDRIPEPTGEPQVLLRLKGKQQTALHVESRAADVFSGE